MSAKLKKEESEFQARIDELNIKKSELETKIAVRTIALPPPPLSLRACAHMYQSRLGATVRLRRPASRYQCWKGMC